MKTVKEVSRITGVSVRTLHHYDAIGLLKPTAVTKAGYRLYDDAALKRMQSILFFRELQFPLKDIKRILDAPDFDPMTALSQQVHLLEMQREHLEQLISHAREIQRTGVFSMDFSKFDTSEIEKYAVEAKQKWGKTQAWQEFEAKNLPPRQAQEIGAGLARERHGRDQLEGVAAGRDERGVQPAFGALYRREKTFEVNAKIHPVFHKTPPIRQEPAAR